MKKIVALALLCLGFVALSCEEEKIGGEEITTSLKVLGGDTIDIYVGDTAYIKVEHSPHNAPMPRLYFYGYDQLMMRAYLQEECIMIIARKRGTTTFNIGDRDSDASTSCVINISPAPFNLAHTERELCVADTFTIKPILPPEVAKNIRWESSNPRVATISSNGMIRALSAGECEISAVAYVNSDTLCSDKCRLTVHNVDMASLVLSDTLKKVLLQETFRLKAIYHPLNTTFTDFKWSSSDDAVAMVDSCGLVIAVGTGSCIISVKDNLSGKVATCNVTVIPQKMTSLQLSDTKLELKLWQKHVLGVSFEPDDASFQEMHWVSSNEGVATVADGEIEAVGVGNCVISVTNKENGLTAKCDVIVYEVKMTSLLLNNTLCNVRLGEKNNLRASFEPATASYPELYWNSSDEKIAVVDNNGEVATVSVGTCTISVTNKDKSLTAECKVNVYTIEITSISCLNEKTLEIGEAFELSATYSYAPAYGVIENNPLRWYSSDESVAKVDMHSGKVTGVGVGECTITVGNTYNDVKAECHLTVLPVSVKGLSLDRSSLTIVEGRTDKLSCTVTPANATNKAVKWESSDESVVTVSDDGTVTAIGEGKATIKVTALDGSGSSAECAVRVVAYVTYVEDYIENYISIIQTGFSMTNNGIYYTLTATNNGDVTVYLKEARGYGSMAGSISIKEELTPGRSYSGTFNTDKIDWVFEINGVECVKRY